MEDEVESEIQTEELEEEKPMGKMRVSPIEEVKRAIDDD